MQNIKTSTACSNIKCVRLFAIASPCVTFQDFKQEPNSAFKLDGALRQDEDIYRTTSNYVLI